ncbi:DMT family transporter [Frankia sp. AgB32]|uniref:DMT family transporter n=1 Tax=Frankia sp. AgB32 TaxID=631119 RepID=UPI00200D10B6|nr:DMT family transporter [Frankia sp. AgB32]MCK9894950.1 DMT family transporter [Frankia sp. AgB32]
MSTPRTPLAGATRRASLAGATGMMFVGAGVAVSGVLADAALYPAQALRYTLGCALLLLLARCGGRVPHRPRGTEWLWLLGVSVTGLVVFNVALVRGSRHAEPAVLGVAVACVPVVMAACGPLLEHRRPQARVLCAALVVTAGSALVEGVGRSDTAGLLWALVTFACEAAFTLLAVPVLPRLGAHGVSVHVTWLAALIFTVLGIATGSWPALGRLDAADLLAIGYLATAVTAVAFVLWYSCVRTIGAARAGLLTGVAPAAAAAISVPVTGTAPAPLVWVGITVVALGLAVGLSEGPPHPRSTRTREPHRLDRAAAAVGHRPPARG